jgi:hypothetical protein
LRAFKTSEALLSQYWATDCAAFTAEDLERLDEELVLLGLDYVFLFIWYETLLLPL